MMGVVDRTSNMMKLCLLAFFFAAVSGLVSCNGDAPPSPQSQVVKKKIAVQKDKLSAESAKKAVQQEMIESESKAAKKEKTIAEPEKRKPTSSNLVEESMVYAGGYDPKGRFDPFEPLFKDEPDQQPAPARKNRKRRTPRTPLERVALSQLKLSAIMRTTKGNSAIVEDATGKGYLIRKGTYIGLNSGQVVRIDKDRVQIEEESEDISGEYRIQNTELKLQKPAGEL